MKIDYLIKETEHGLILKDILRKRMLLSAAAVKRLKQKNVIYVNGNSVFTNYKVSAGDMVTVDIGVAEPVTDVIAENGELDIIFEDEWLLAVNKPSGQIVHPSHSRYTGTLMNYAAGYMSKEGAVCHSVNRLDRDTSGVVLLAKNAVSKYRTAESLKSSGTVKEYVALLAGKMPQNVGVIDAPIKRYEEGKMLRVVSSEGERAITHYSVVGAVKLYDKDISLVKFVLETGRTHQIRVHSLHMGCPILGDRLYCNDDSLEISEKGNINSCLLHARELKFIHPFSGEEINLIAPIRRKDFLDLMDKFNANPIDSF